MYCHKYRTLTRIVERTGDTAVRLQCVQVKLWAMTDKLGITPKLKADDKELVGKPLMKRIMQAWLPAHEVRPSGSPLQVCQ